MHVKHTIYLCLLMTGVLALSSIGRVAVAEIHEVQVANFSFTPDEIDIVVGDTVRWVWVGGTHTATSGSNCTPDGLFDAPLNSSSTSFEFTFESLGDVPYFCVPHCGLGMDGVVRVGQSTAVEEEAGFDRSATAGVITAAPNPFESATTVHYSLPSEQSVRLVIVDATGRIVAVPTTGRQAAGSHSVEWDGRTTTGTAAVSGTYFARLETATRSATRSLLLLR